MSIQRLIQKQVDTIRENESAQTAAAIMHQRSVGSLVIVDAKLRPIGIITDRDLTVKVLAAGRDPFTTRVGDVMTCQPTTVDERTSLDEALRKMSDGPFRRLPIVDAAGSLIGVVSLDDILGAITDRLDRVARLVGRETPCAAACETFASKSSVLPGKVRTALSKSRQLQPRE